MWETLLDHAKAFQQADHITAAQKRDCDMGKLFAARAESCYHPSIPLAYLLDPVHMQRDGSTWNAPFVNVSECTAEQGAAQCACSMNA